MCESEFQRNLIRHLKKQFIGCVIFKNDSGYMQGLPDLTILYKNKWAALECKKDRYAPYRPNQEYYLDILNKMSFADVVYPENEDEVIMKLYNFFGD